MRSTLAALLSCIAICLPTIGTAGQIGLNDFSGSETVQDFTGTRQAARSFTLDGVTYTGTGDNIGSLDTFDRFGFFGDVPASNGDMLANNIAEGNFTMDFSQVVNRVAFYLADFRFATFSISIFDDTQQLLDSFSVSTGAGGVFFGFESLQDIFRVQIVEIVVVTASSLCSTTYATRRSQCPSPPRWRWFSRDSWRSVGAREAVGPNSDSARVPLGATQTPGNSAAAGWIGGDGARATAPILMAPTLPVGSK
ncbi:MAG: hypothetical protein AAGA68_08340 [Pseudomonadota bacterium]